MNSNDNGDDNMRFNYKNFVNSNKIQTFTQKNINVKSAYFLLNKF